MDLTEHLAVMRQSPWRVTGFCPLLDCKWRTLRLEGELRQPLVDRARQALINHLDHAHPGWQETQH